MAPPTVDDLAAETELGTAGVSHVGATHAESRRALLQPAQRQLAAQLAATKERLQQEVREATHQLQEAGRERAAAGAELHSHQASLEALQKRLAGASREEERIKQDTAAADEEAGRLRQEVAAEAKLTRRKRERVEALQQQLQAASSTLRHAELAGERGLVELGVVKRATYAADERVLRQDKQREERDSLADHLEEQLRCLQTAAANHAAQCQQRCAEIAAAREQAGGLQALAAEVNGDMAVLTRRWNDALGMLRKRDAALVQALEAGKKKQEQRAAVVAAMSRQRCELKAERLRNEQRAERVRCLEVKAEQLTAQTDAAEQRGKQTHAARQEAETLVAAGAIQVEAALAEGLVIQRDCAELGRQRGLVDQEIQVLESRQLEHLCQKSGTDHAVQRIVKDIHAADAAAWAKSSELSSAQLAADAAAAELEATEARNAALSCEAKAAESALAARVAEVEGAERALQRLHRDIEQATKAVQAANRELQRRAESFHEEDTGPLENTVANLQRETWGKQCHAQALRRQWADLQQKQLAEHEGHGAAAQQAASVRDQAEELHKERAKLAEL